MSLRPAPGLQRQLPCLRLFMNLVTGRHVLTLCVPPSHVIGRDKESRCLPQMNSHPAQNPGMEEKARKSREKKQKLSKCECVLKPSEPQPMSNPDSRSMFGEHCL